MKWNEGMTSTKFKIVCGGGDRKRRGSGECILWTVHTWRILFVPGVSITLLPLGPRKRASLLGHALVFSNCIPPQGKGMRAAKRHAPWETLTPLLNLWGSPGALTSWAHRITPGPAYTSFLNPSFKGKILRPACTLDPRKAQFVVGDRLVDNNTWMYRLDSHTCAPGPSWCRVEHWVRE